jgi:hypothetical protein
VGDVSVALGRVIGVIVLGRHGGATVAAAGSAAARRAVVSSWGGRVVSCVCGVAAVVFCVERTQRLGRLGVFSTGRPRVY